MGEGAFEAVNPTPPRVPKVGDRVCVRWFDGVESPAVVTRTQAATRPGSSHGIYSPNPDRWGQYPQPHLPTEMHVDLQVFGVLAIYPLWSVRPSFSPTDTNCWFWGE